MFVGNISNSGFNKIINENKIEVTPITFNYLKLFYNISPLLFNKFIKEINTKLNKGVNINNA
jgi:hypothetical protein